MKRPFRLTAPKSHPEDDLHISVAEWLDWMLLPPAVWTTFPAGWGKLPKATAGRLKTLGLKPGFPDILIFHDRRCVGIELKAGSSTSSAQRTMHALLKAAGVNVYVARSIDEVRTVLFAEGLPMRRHSFMVA